MNWLRWQPTTVPQRRDSVSLAKGWQSERKRDARQADRAAHWHTFSRWKNGDLLLFSGARQPPPPPFNQTYYGRLIPKCEWTILYAAPFLLSVISCCIRWRTTVETNLGFFPPSSRLNMVFFFAINLFPAAHLFFSEILPSCCPRIATTSFLCFSAAFLFHPSPPGPLCSPLLCCRNKDPCDSWHSKAAKYRNVFPPELSYIAMYIL